MPGHSLAQEIPGQGLAVAGQTTSIPVKGYPNAMGVILKCTDTVTPGGGITGTRDASKVFKTITKIGPDNRKPLKLSDQLTGYTGIATEAMSVLPGPLGIDQVTQLSAALNGAGQQSLSSYYYIPGDFSKDCILSIQSYTMSNAYTLAGGAMGSYDERVVSGVKYVFAGGPAKDVSMVGKVKDASDNVSFKGVNGVMIRLSSGGTYQTKAQILAAIRALTVNGETFPSDLIERLDALSDTRLRSMHPPTSVTVASTFAQTGGTHLAIAGPFPVAANDLFTTNTLAITGTVTSTGTLVNQGYLSSCLFLAFPKAVDVTLTFTTTYTIEGLAVAYERELSDGDVYNLDEQEDLSVQYDLDQVLSDVADQASFEENDFALI
jgi:hypothetical protein